MAERGGVYDPHIGLVLENYIETSHAFSVLVTSPRKASR